MENLKLLKRAKLAVKDKRIIKLQVINSYLHTFIFLAKDTERHNDHLLTEDSCDCNYFVFNKIYKNGNFCYHVLALRIALESEDLVQINVSTDVFTQILVEIFNNGKSLKLRRLIYS